jgi:alanine racemase
MEAVVSLTAPILQLRDVVEPAAIGYGATYLAEPPARIAVLGIGYADGYPRNLGNVGTAAVGGRRVPVVGRVSMDLTTIDVGALPRETVRVGDPVELIGPAVGLDEVAAAASTISCEILTGMGRRLVREYVEND